MSDMKQKFAELANLFQIPGQIKNIRTVNNGHINSTYDVIIAREGVDHRFIFQKINSFVFKEPEKIMRNIERITAHIGSKLEKEGKSRDGVMHFAHMADGKNFYMEQDGFWRISEFVPNVVTINSCADLSALRSAGTAFGNFQIMLSDFDASLLYETIPNFHNTKMRLDALTEHVQADTYNRVSEIEAELESVDVMREEAVRLTAFIEEKKLPLRVTHNDTKINNVLFDRDTLEAKTVIDLDTVMPGLVAYDFGDAIRFAANKVAEDEPDAKKAGIDMERFRAFAEGFLPQIASELTPMEIETMALGAFTMTFEVGIRFLDDYVNGDVYFKIEYPKHNLVRARCQLALAKDMLIHMDEMNAIVKTIVDAARQQPNE